MSNEIIEKEIESLKREGKISQDAEYKIIEKFSEEDIGKLVVFDAQVKGIAVKLSPRIKTITIDGAHPINHNNKPLTLIYDNRGGVG